MELYLEIMEDYLMKYLTKEWYELGQKFGLHICMKVNKGAAVYDEELYLKLYKIEEKEYVKSQKDSYNFDPRYFLEQEGQEIRPIDKFLSGEEIPEEEKMFYHIPPEERADIEKRIAEYDARPLFDEEKCIEEFRNNQEAIKQRLLETLPSEIIQQIADTRVFALRYCTEEILEQLEKISIENKMISDQILEEYQKAEQKENIPEDLNRKFCFHDCTVTEFTVDSNIVIRFDTRGGFTNLNKVTFVSADIIKLDSGIMDSRWIYEELYRTDIGYEAHMLFDGEGVLADFIVSCKDIIIEKEEKR